MIAMASTIDQSGLQGKIRDQPICPDLELVLRRAADEAGLDTVLVTSGGQPGTSGRRTGSTRHDGGRAADLKLRKNGQILQFSDDAADPAIAEFVRAAAAHGAIGLGAGVNYMGPETLHIGFGLSSDDHRRLTWGAEGRAEHSPAWLAAAAKKGWAQRGETPVETSPRVSTSGVSAAALQLLDFIGALEAGPGPSGFDRIFGRHQPLMARKLTAMSLDEVLAFQGQMLRGGSPSTAVGRYQFLQKTLLGLKNRMGLNGATLFSSNLQDQLGNQLLLERGLPAFLQRRASLEQFGLALAQEWASLPVLRDVNTKSGVKRRGQSYYESGLNHALVGADRFEARLNDVLTTAQMVGQQAGKGIPMPPAVPVGSTPVSLPNSDVSKPWYLSKGVIGSLVAIALPIISLFFPLAKLANPTDITDWIFKLGPAVGGVIALIGRLQARQPIGGTSAAQEAAQQQLPPSPDASILSLPFINVIEQLPAIVAGLQQLHSATGILGSSIGNPSLADAKGVLLAGLSDEASGDRSDAGLLNGGQN
jgi:hypothetical protein